MDDFVGGIGDLWVDTIENEEEEKIDMQQTERHKHTPKKQQ